MNEVLERAHARMVDTGEPTNGMPVEVMVLWRQDGVVRHEYLVSTSETLALSGLLLMQHASKLAKEEHDL